MTDLETAWLAGILEGEGWFGWYTNGHGKKLPTVEVAMTDRDVIERVARLFGASTYIYARSRGGNRIPIYRIRARGGTATRVMEAVLPLMGERRAEKIRGLLR